MAWDFCWSGRVSHDGPASRNRPLLPRRDRRPEFAGNAGLRLLLNRPQALVLRRRKVLAGPIAGGVCMAVIGEAFA